MELTNNLTANRCSTWKSKLLRVLIFKNSFDAEKNLNMTAFSFNKEKISDIVIKRELSRMISVSFARDEEPCWRTCRGLRVGPRQRYVVNDFVHVEPLLQEHEPKVVECSNPKQGKTGEGD